MNVEFLADARAEFLQTVAYYNQEREGSALEFSEEVRSVIERIVQYPEARSLVSRRTRHCRTKRFPFGIIYQVKDDTLPIIAVMNLHRDPQ